MDSVPLIRSAFRPLSDSQFSSEIKVRVRVDGIEGATFYLDHINAKNLITMMTRDLAKLRLCFQVDPEGVR